MSLTVFFDYGEWWCRYSLAILASNTKISYTTEKQPTTRIHIASTPLTCSKNALGINNRLQLTFVAFRTIPQSHNPLPITTAQLMLAPLNSVKIHPLLYKLPQRAQLAQERNTLLDSLEHIVDLSIRRESSDTKTNTAVRALVTAS